MQPEDWRSKGSRYREVDLSGLRTCSIAERGSKVQVENFASARPLREGLSGFLAGLPRILAGDDFRAVVEAIVRARKQDKPVIMAFGAHVIKCGLSPVVIELLEQGVLTALATHGAGALHDCEIALFGETSEDVEAGLETGLFGLARETAAFLNETVSWGAQGGLGLGECLGRRLEEVNAPYAEVSVLAAAYRLGRPLTVHVALGTDIVHMHPNCSGAAYGETSLRDFRILTQALTDLGAGGVLLNVGSAVILPEVLLKALTLAKNLGHDLSGFLSVNLDFLRHYRPHQQVVHRVQHLSSQGIALTGHHEILLPLIAWTVLEQMNR